MLRRILLSAAVLFAACSAGGDLVTHGDPTGPNDPSRTGTGGQSTGTSDRAPVTAPDTFHVVVGQTLVISSLLANDSDPDGDALRAFPAGSAAFVAYDSTTGHVEYQGHIGMWQDNRSRGTAFAWNPSGGFSFTAASDAQPGEEDFYYRAYEDTPAALASDSTKVVILVDSATTHP